MLFGHGWGKLVGFGEVSDRFPDPIGVGSTPRLALAFFAEVLCALLIMVDLGTRFAAVPLMATMLVAAFIVHGDDPWGKKELALLCAIPFLTSICTGGGRYSVDAVIRHRIRAHGSRIPGDSPAEAPVGSSIWRETLKPDQRLSRQTTGGVMEVKMV